MSGEILRQDALPRIRQAIDSVITSATPKVDDRASQKAKNRDITIRRELQALTGPLETDDDYVDAFGRILVLGQAEIAGIKDVELEYFGIDIPSSRESKALRLEVMARVYQELDLQSEQLDGFDFVSSGLLADLLNQFYLSHDNLAKNVQDAGYELNDITAFIRRYLGQKARSQKLAGALFDKEKPKTLVSAFAKPEPALEATRSRWRQENRSFLDNPALAWVGPEHTEQFAKTVPNSSQRGQYTRSATIFSATEDRRALSWSEFILRNTPHRYSEVSNNDWEQVVQIFHAASTKSRLQILSPTCPGYKTAKEETFPDGTILTTTGLEIGPGTSVITQKVIDCGVPFAIHTASSGIASLKWSIGIAEFEALTKRNLKLRAAGDDPQAQQDAIKFFADQTNQGLQQAAERVLAKLQLADSSLDLSVQDRVIHSSLGFDFDIQLINVTGKNIPGTLLIEVGIAEQIFGSSFIQDVESAKKRAQADLEDPGFLKATAPSLKRRSTFYAGLMGHPTPDADLSIYLPLYTEHLAEYRAMSEIVAQLGQTEGPTMALCGDSYTMWTAPGTAQIAKLFAARTDDGKNYPGAV
jgi:hypothetical protein